MSSAQNDGDGPVVGSIAVLFGQSINQPIARLPALFFGRRSVDRVTFLVGVVVYGLPLVWLCVVFVDDEPTNQSCVFLLVFYLRLLILFTSLPSSHF